MRGMKKIVLFGAGEYGKHVIESYYLNTKDALIFCDNDIKKQGIEIYGIKVLSFDQIKEMYEEEKINKIVITTYKINEILYQCISNKINIKDLFYYNKERNLIEDVCDAYNRTIYSQEGEEIYLIERFKNTKKGIYIDVGANHPYRFSNTFWAYLKGWRGINIEPNNYNYRLLDILRNKDVNINCGIAEHEEEKDYYEFSESAINTFCIEKLSLKESTENIINVRKVKMRRLDSICKEYNLKKVEFINIDVEGMEIEVLRSINWDEIEFECVLIEHRKMTLLEILKSEVCNFMIRKGFVPVTQYGQTVIYEKRD